IAFFKNFQQSSLPFVPIIVLFALLGVEAQAAALEGTRLIKSSRKRLVWSFLGRRYRKLGPRARQHLLARRRRLNRNILGTILTFSLLIGIASASLFLRLSAGPLDL